jgi:hypothetical protein
MVRPTGSSSPKYFWASVRFTTATYRLRGCKWEWQLCHEKVGHVVVADCDGRGEQAKQFAVIVVGLTEAARFAVVDA